MSAADLAYAPATGLARLIREKQVSPVDVVDAAIARIEAVNPALNAFCFTYPEEAREKAKAAEAAVAKGETLGPLHGVPVAFKDFTPTRGKVTTRGSRLLADWVPDEQPALVRRLLDAGAIMVGKTTTPEFASSGFTKSPLWGVTRNPWDTARSPGGSSGGSGAAVASGCVPLAEGTDMGGSVRIPAAFCGTVGFKPSLGRLPMDIVGTCFDNITHFGVLARTVGDAALFVAAGQGPHPADIQSLPACDMPVPVPADVRGLAIAVDADLGFYAVDPAVERNLMRVADALRDAGATVDEVDLGLTKDAVDFWYENTAVYMAALFAETFGDTLAEKRHLMDPAVVQMVEDGRRVDAVTYKRFEMIRTRLWHRFAALFEDHHALLCPTTTMTAPANDLSDADFDWEDDAGRYHGYDITALFNWIAPCPALSVPSGAGADGLPTAAQIVARKWDDPLALRIGAAIEKALPWADRHPPV